MSQDSKYIKQSLPTIQPQIQQVSNLPLPTIQYTIRSAYQELDIFLCRGREGWAVVHLSKRTKECSGIE